MDKFPREVSDMRVGDRIETKAYGTVVVTSIHPDGFGLTVVPLLGNTRLIRYGLWD